MRYSYDVIISGAGPSGLHTAKLCKDKGYSVLVLEEHDRIGEPVHCSGLVSKRVAEFVPLAEIRNAIENEINSAVIHSPTSSFELRKRRTAAFVINRVKFDSYLANLLGGGNVLKARVLDFGIKKRMVVKTSRGRFRSEMLIGCDGANSLVAGKCGQRPAELVNGVIGINKGRNYSDNVDIYFDKRRIADGFFWRIPRGKTTEFGAFGRGVNFRYLEEFFGTGFGKKYGGIIPIGPVRKTYFPRVLLAGDAAGLTKPWSGGGVIFSMESSRAAARAIDKAFRFDDFSENTLSAYERMWKERLERPISLGLFSRKMLKIMGNFHIEALVKMAKVLPKNWMDMDFIFVQ
ncbi:MAG: NAD(P)/FAD-dependent oxidoreductase [Candidatus Aenigmarchaeota archaeon]|nr:NAD(P)/FAD-dependent oxidoreductase [Candidatus Aenigmarchaeota archaeon]